MFDSVNDTRLMIAGRVVSTAVISVVVFGGTDRQEQALETCEAPNAEQSGGSVGAARFSLGGAVGVKLRYIVVVPDVVVVVVVVDVLWSMNQRSLLQHTIWMLVHSNRCRGHRMVARTGEGVIVVVCAV